MERLSNLSRHIFFQYFRNEVIVYLYDVLFASQMTAEIPMRHANFHVSTSCRQTAQRIQLDTSKDYFWLLRIEAPLIRVYFPGLRASLVNSKNINVEHLNSRWINDHALSAIIHHWMFRDHALISHDYEIMRRNLHLRPFVFFWNTYWAELCTEEMTPIIVFQIIECFFKFQSTIWRYFQAFYQLMRCNYWSEHRFSLS